MLRTSLTLRLIFVVAAALFLFQIFFLVAIYRAGSRSAAEDFRFPLPTSVGAIVELIEASPPAQRQRVLQAIQSSRFQATIEARPQASASETALRLPGLEAILQRYIALLGERHVSAMIDLPEGETTPFKFRFRSTALLSSHAILLNIELSSGEYLILRTRSEEGPPLLVWPLGLGGGLLALAAAITAIAMIWVETKPLRDLSSSVQRFAKDMVVQPVEEKGADDLMGLIRSFNEMQDQVAKLYHGRTELLLAISHDIRTYLTRLRMRIESLPEDKRVLAERDIEDMLSFTNEALTLASAEAESSLPDVVDVSELVRDVIDSLPAEEREKVSYQTVEGEPLKIRSNIPQLRRALTNVIDNALKYGSRAALTLESSPQAVGIVLEDEGPGIAPSERAKVLDPFYRIEQSRNRQLAGTGLGLAITNRIIQSHQGRLLLDDREDGSSGLKLKILLPRFSHPEEE